MLKDKEILDELIRNVELVAMDDSHPIYRSLYGAVRIGCLVIVDDWYRGVVIAYESGFAHRQTKQSRALALVSSPKVSLITPGSFVSLDQPVPMSVDWAKRELPPEALGCTPRPLFDGNSIEWPTPALFLYPENYLVVKEERRFVDECLKQRISNYIYIITKSPIIVGEIVPEAMLLIKE